MSEYTTYTVRRELLKELADGDINRIEVPDVGGGVAIDAPER